MDEIEQFLKLFANEGRFATLGDKLDQAAILRPLVTVGPVEQKLRHEIQARPETDKNISGYCIQKSQQF
jgi:hypothetical protein